MKMIPAPSIKSALCLFYISSLLGIYSNLEAETTPTNFFTNGEADITLETLLRRKWDNPVVADLDQDGFTDLLLMDHGRLAKVHWNNGKGGFLPPVNIKGGDLHGITVGDFDQNGTMNVIISLGGGGGSKPSTPLCYEFTTTREIRELPELAANLPQGRGRAVKFIDGDNDGDLDLVLAATNGKNTTESQNTVYVNDGQGGLQLHSRLPKTKGEAQRLKITDFNNDGIVDIIIYGVHFDIRLFQGNGDLSYKEVTESILGGENIDYVTGIAEIDYDNDGDFDLYLTRSAEVGRKYIYHNKDKQKLALSIRGNRNYDIKGIQSGDTFSATNFQKIFKKQLLLGEDQTLFEPGGDWHAGVDFEVAAKDALGFPDTDSLEDNKFYIGYEDDGTWRFAGKTRYLSTIILNDVALKENYDEPLKQYADILLQNQNGKLVNVTDSAQLAGNLNNTGVAVADYDNNGHQDLFVVKHGDLTTSTKQRVFLNNGDHTFRELEDHSIVSHELGSFGMGADALDYNQDGRMDIMYTNERGLWHLVRNELPMCDDTHYTQIRVGNSPSGKASALGAIVTLNAGDQTQTRRIGDTAAPYSQSFDNLIHFGLGSADKADSITVKWSNGETSTLQNVKSDSIVSIPAH